MQIMHIKLNKINVLYFSPFYLEFILSYCPMSVNKIFNVLIR